MPACPSCGRHYEDRDFVPGTRLRCACGRWIEVTEDDAAGTAGPRADVRAHRCPSCGGSVAADRTTCPYCRSTLLTRPCPSCFAGNFEDAVHCVSCGERLDPALTAARGASLACPRCGDDAALRPVPRADVAVQTCTRCSGAFVPHEDLADLRSGRADWPLHASPGERLFREQRVRYLRCSFCDTLMRRRGIGRTGVVVDECARHGVWFDVGELTRVLGRVRERLPEDMGSAAPAAPASPAQKDTEGEPSSWSDADRALVERLIRIVTGED